jgi:hypothetical protein
MNLVARLRKLLKDGCLDLPLPGSGNTALRHWRLAQIARENLELGRLAEAHADALAILHEAGRNPKEGALYGVWAAEGGEGLKIVDGTVSGQKEFCTGAGIVDYALVTVMRPDRCLLEIHLKGKDDRVCFDTSKWVTDAFANSATATASFSAFPIGDENFVGSAGWYLDRPGFWHGACGPASCWAGGAAGLIDYARLHARATNLHALAHLGALRANEWQLWALLQVAGAEIDKDFDDVPRARVRALSLRHLVEHSCSDTLSRFGRAFGPRPLAFEPEIARRSHELTLYIRQCHAESDLEELGRGSLASAAGGHVKLNR